MSDLIDGFQWLTTAENWWGPNGIAVRLREHIWYSVVATIGAALIGIPIGLAVGHTGKGRFLATNVAGLADCARRTGARSPRATRFPRSRTAMAFRWKRS